MKEYKNGYLLTDEEHDYAVKHKHVWIEEKKEDSNHPAIQFRQTLNISHCECGAMKMLTAYGWRVIISYAPNRESRSLELKEPRKGFFSIFDF